MNKQKRAEHNKAKQQGFDEWILEYIRFCNGFGCGSKVSIISARFGISERTVRQSIERLRENNIIWNFQDGFGYFIGETDTEKGNRLNDKWLAQEDARAIKCFMHSRFARSKRNNPNQTKFDGYVAELLNEVTVKSVVEMYFEYFSKVCYERTFPKWKPCEQCLNKSACDILFIDKPPYSYTFTDLTPAQITALEPYAIKWAESEGTK